MRFTQQNDDLENAAETMQFAQRVSSMEDKGRLLRLAEAWLDWADRARQVTRRLRKSGPVHPLVEQTFDRHPDE